MTPGMGFQRRQIRNSALLLLWWLWNIPPQNTAGVVDPATWALMSHSFVKYDPKENILYVKSGETKASRSWLSALTPALKRKSSSRWTHSGRCTGVLGEFCWGSESRVGQIACSSQRCRGQRVMRKGSCSPRWMVSLFGLPQQLHSAGPADTTVAVWERNGNEMLASPKKVLLLSIKTAKEFWQPKNNPSYQAIFSCF